VNLRDKYIKKGYKKVDGWFEEKSLLAISLLSDFQVNNSINGSLIEIGIHQGRSFILLNLCTKKDEITIGYDIFDNQEQNIDYSGCGDKTILLNNLKKNYCNFDRIKIIKENSLNLLANGIINEAKKKSRIFIIDGGHTYDVVYNDLILADKVLCKGGIIIVDDVFDFSFPQVSVAFLQFLKSNKHLIPFLIVEDKVFLTNSSTFSKLYFNYLHSFQSEFIIRTTEYLSNNVIVIKKSHNDFFRKTKFWQKIKNTDFGNKIRKILK